MPLNPQSSLARLFNAPVKSGVLIWIGVRPERRIAIRPVEEAMLDTHVGLGGDHYSRDSGNRQVTLIQAESLAAIASHLGLETVAPEMLRRNLVTRGINLMGKRRARAALDLATVRRQSGSHYLNGGNYFDIRKIALGQS